MMFSAYLNPSNINHTLILMILTSSCTFVDKYSLIKHSLIPYTYVVVFE